MSDRAKEFYQAALDKEQVFDFESAKKIYEEIKENFSGTDEAANGSRRIAAMDDLIKEKQIYQRIDENAKRVLTDIGVNIVENQTLMDILMEADAIDFDNTTAVSLPLKGDYIDQCLEKVPRELPGDPGPNAFGTGATPPFLKRLDGEELKVASRDEFEQIVKAVGDNADVVKIFSLPVQFDKSISGFEAAKIMDKGFSGLKMTAAKSFNDDEMTFFKGRDDWMDGTSLLTTLAPMGTMVEPFIRSARSGANLLLLDLTIAGSSGPGSPESLLTMIHAQEIFMMVLAQTITPGIRCIHGGIPGVDEAGGDLSYTSKSQPLINSAMARVNQWITKFPSAQSGGSTSLTEVDEQAIKESAQSRDTIRTYGAHIVRHSLGALGSLNFFSKEKFIKDCEQERASLKTFAENPFQGIRPLYFPKDPETMAGIREIAEKGNPKHADHTLRNVESFMNWEKRIAQKG